MFGFSVLGIVDDAVSWLQAATLMLAIVITGVVLLATLIVGHLPLGEKWPVIGPYVIPARLVSFLAFGALCALITLQFAGDRCDAQRAADREAAEAARVDRDDGISKLLTDKYGPEISRLAKLNDDLQGKVAYYAKRKPVVVAAGGRCKLGAAAHQLRP